MRKSFGWIKAAARSLIGLLACASLIGALASGETFAAAAATNAAAVSRPATWAQPVAKPGLPNFHKISDQLYRGAQPTADGMKELSRLGIKTVIDLRSFHSDKALLKGTGLAYESIPMKAWHAESEDVFRFLSIVTDTNKMPVFVHCQHGADRTGTMNAIYRMVVQGWTKEQAIQEMTGGGFGFHPVWANLIKFIQEFDVDGVKRAAGLKP
jgi:protein tyrosine/serine phosphatase